MCGMNKLLFGDNLKWLRDTQIFPNASVDLVYLVGDVSNQKFTAGILITLEPPTKPMREEAVDAGRYKANLLYESKSYPKIQILTVEGLMNKTEQVDAPPQANPFLKAQQEGIRENRQVLV